MSRPLRIEFPGGLFHVTSRGDRREAIYLDDADRQQWLTLLGQVCQRFNWVCHAYCLMDNHFHIVVETLDGNLSAGMRQLNGVYTQWHNRVHDRVGHVFQGRFKAVVVQRESYLLELARYVVLNPVRAGIGLPSVWDDLKSQLYLGDEDFACRLQQQTQSKVGHTEIPRAQRRAAAPPLAYFVARPVRNGAMAQAYATGCYSFKEIGQAFGLHYATVSRLVRAAELTLSG